MATTKISKEEREEALLRLRNIFPKGATAHTIVRHVTASGMGRAISVIAVVGGDPMDVSWLVARLGTFRLHPQHRGLKVQGAGMDMAFHVVYTLSQDLYGDGYALNQQSI